MNFFWFGMRHGFEQLGALIYYVPQFRFRQLRIQWRAQNDYYRRLIEAPKESQP